jgi:radical SAM superfamily enzyme YgiQ (UPF0313 family)
VRVLLLNPERPETFWNLKQISEFAGRKALAPPLGLITVAALLPRPWDCRLVDLNTRRLTEEDWRWADLVMLSGMQIQKDSLLQLIREAKERGKTVVTGGPFPTSVPQEVLEAGADFLVRGEAEEIMPRFLAALAENQKQGVFEEQGKPDLTKSPIPRFDLLNLEDYTTPGVQTSRGCPFNCEFCDVVNLYGRKPRHKTPEQVIAELETLYRLGWRRDVFICDDNFVGYQGHAQAVLSKLIPWMESHGEPFSFWTQVSLNLGQDKELIDLLTAANFSTVFTGIESPDEAVLASNRKFQNIKNPPGPSLTNICTNGLSVMISFMIGFDNEKKGVDERICAFVEKNHIPMVVLNILQALPNTNLWDRLQKEGRLLEKRTSGDTQEYLLNYLPTRPPEEILAEYMAAVDRLYEPSRYLERAYRYFLAKRPTRSFVARQRGEMKKPSSNSGINKSRQQQTNLRDLAGLAKIIWWHGILAGYRGQFWRQLLGIYRQNPSRLVKYLICLATGENMFRYRESVLQKRAVR